MKSVREGERDPPASLTQILGRHTAILQLVGSEQLLLLLLAGLSDRHKIGAQICIYIRFSWLGIHLAIYLLIKIGR